MSTPADAPERPLDTAPGLDLSIVRVEKGHADAEELAALTALLLARAAAAGTPPRPPGPLHRRLAPAGAHPRLPRPALLAGLSPCRSCPPAEPAAGRRLSRSRAPGRARAGPAARLPARAARPARPVL